MQNFQELKVWQKAHEFTLAVYQSTRRFPADERFGLTSQIRRAASSIGANLAEGCGRKTRNDLLRFVHIAGGSASECENHLLLARDLEFLAQDDYGKLNAALTETKRMLQGFESAVRRRANDS